jgi:hypothetical protein
MLVPILLLVVLLGVVFWANSRKKQGKMTESAYQTLISVASIIVTVAAIAALVMRMRG